MSKELYHYGIEGQKWGVRRWQNSDGSFNEEGKIRYGRVSHKQAKQIRNEISNKIRDYTKSDSRNKQVNELYKKASELARKYDFDGDDGGGGSTKASQAAGKKYMDINYEIAELQRQIRSDSVAKARKYISETYGANILSAYDKRKKAITGAVFVGIELALIGTISVMAYSDLHK